MIANQSQNWLHYIAISDLLNTNHSKKEMPNKPIKIETISTEDLQKLVKESGLTVAEIEKGVGMPERTLAKSLEAKPDKKGYTRTLPTKWVADTIKFIKEKKVANEELKIEVKEVLIDHNIAVVEPEVDVPNKERKLAWIDKLKDAKT